MIVVRLGWMIALALAAALRAQQPWTAVESPTASTLWGVEFAPSSAGTGGTFVAVGEGGAIATSPDGLAWTSRVSGTDRWLLGVAWSPTLRLFVVVGESGTVLTSPDGSAWTPRPSGTTQRLNSVAWAPKRFTFPDVFLAVGENGTALVSYDAATWMPRATGDTGWLRGIVSLGTDSFVVTGHDGTILLTRDAGESFQRAASGTTRHLDAVARLGGELFATGTDFALVRSSDGGTTWRLDRAVNTDGRENGFVYSGAFAFNNALVVVGDQGRILDEAGRPWRASEPLPTGWRAVAASRDRVVAVGTNGGIATAPADPALGLEHDIDATFLGDTVVLTATRRRPNVAVSSSFTRQWSYNGEPLPDATATTLRLSTTAGAINGVYAFTAATPGGLASTASFTLESQPNPAAFGLVDAAFRPALDAPPGPILPLEDGRVYVTGQDATLSIGGRRVNSPVRLTADGALDESFRVADGVLAGTALALVAQPDGRLVVLERLTGAPPTYRAVRLTAAGAIDPTFRPDPLLFAGGEKPVLLADGRWVAVERRPATPQNYSSTLSAILRRFNSDGSLDPSFAPLTLFTGVTLRDPIIFSGPRVIGTRDAQNRVYLGVQYNDGGSVTFALRSGASRLFRLRPDGTLDPTFSSRDVDPLFNLFATSRGVIARTVEEGFVRLQGSATITSLFRLLADGSSDPGFTRRTLATHVNSSLTPPTGLGNDYNVIAVTPDGGVIARTTGHHGHFGFVRFDPQGELDRNFSAELGGEATGVRQVHVLPDGRLLVAGTFQSLPGVTQRHLARLTPNTRAAATHLGNVSVRSRAGVGAGTLILGYATRGGDSSVLARAAGPSLATFGVSNPLTDPELTLYSGPTPVSGNDDWHAGPAEFLAATAARLNAFPFAAGSKDAALYNTTASNPLTLQITGKGGASGVALAELYLGNAAPADAAAPRITNVSVRSMAGEGSDTLIVGFTLSGPNTRNILLRGIGPGLARFGVADYLPDPALTLFRGNAAIAVNDNWAPSNGARLTLTEAFTTVGAFPLEASATRTDVVSGKDSALLISLAPGSYTAHVAGKSGASGVALVEIYEVP